MSRFHVTAQLGPKQSLTPEGYLLCEAVPIARTGTQLYAAGEIPGLVAGDDGLIHVQRNEDEVFNPATMASFEGKSVTIGHTFVDPQNVQYTEVGHVQNVRRGTEDTTLLLADLLIKAQRAIDSVRYDPNQPDKKTLREVSCGYDSTYYQDLPGVAEQRNIIGNHVAIVKNGRAGPRCSIQDEEIMTDTTKQPANLLKRMIAAVRSKDADLIARTIDDAEAEVETEAEKAKREASQKTADGLSELRKTVDTLAAAVTGLVELAKPPIAAVVTGKTADEIAAEQRTADEAVAQKAQAVAAMADVASRAEILVPGFVVQTADNVANMEVVAGIQRAVLADAVKTEEGKAAVEPLLMGRAIAALTADQTASVFVASSEILRHLNNARGARAAQQTTDHQKRGPVTPDDLNAINKKFYSQQS